MSNDFYTPSGTPSTGSQLQSAPMRTELASIEAGFNKLPGLTSNGGKTVRVNAGGTALDVSKVTITEPATGATLTIADGATLATAGAYSTTLTATGATNVTLPTTGTLATLAGSETLTNKTLTDPAINGTVTTTGLTLPALTLGGTLSGGGNQINNVIIGASTPLAGSFTTLSATGNVTLGDASTDTLNVGNGGFLKDASGNIGIGITPKTWFASSRAIQIGDTGAIESRISGNVTQLLNNAYINAAGNYAYISTAATGKYTMSAGVHTWHYAASGSADAAITYTTLATLDSTGLAVTGALSATGTTQGTLSLNRSSNVAATSVPSSISCSAPNASSVSRTWSSITTVVDDATNSSEDSSLYFTVQKAGTPADVLIVSGTGAAVTGTLSATSSVAGPYAGLTTTNANAGTTAYSGVSVSNGTASGALLTAGTGYTTYGVITANSTGLYTNASAGLFLGCDHASGSVRIGIGTNTPQIASFTSTAFSLTGTSSAGSVAASVANSAANGYSVLELKNTGASGKTFEIGVGGNGTAGSYQNALYFRDASGNPTMSLTNNNVAVTGLLSATSTASALQVTAAYSGSAYSFLGHNNTNGYAGTFTNHPFILRTNNVDRLTIDTSGNVTVTGTVAVSGTNQFYVNGAGSGDYFQGVSAGISRIVAGGGEVIRFAGTGVSVTGLISATTTLGYATGAGGAVTQATSRTTGVTINKACGAITLVSAAGSTSWQSFTVTNSTVAATDTVRVSQWDGTTDIYEIHTLVSAGAFRIFFRTMSGTTTEQPVFNFTVIKGVTS